MKLCILTSSYPSEPGESINSGVFVRDFAIACNSLVPVCMVFTHRKKRPGDYRDNVPIVEYPWLGTEESLTSVNLKSPLGMVKAASLIVMGAIHYLRQCRRERINHSLAMWVFPSGVYAYLAKRICGVPYSVWALGSDIWRYESHPLIRPLLRRILQEADHVFADGMELSDRVSTICERDCSFLPSTRDLSQIEAVSVNDKSAHPRFLFVGRYEHNKGPDILLQAARLYFNRGGSGSFNFFGDGSFQNQLQSYLSDHDLGSNVVLHDAIGTTDLVARLRWCDYLVIPSRMESIPVILSDALQLGTPVIATDVGDLGDIVRQMAIGRVVPPHDPKQLADVLLSLENTEIRPLALPIGLRTPLTKPTETAQVFLQIVGFLEPLDKNGRPNAETANVGVSL